VTHDNVDEQFQQLLEIYRRESDIIVAIGECGIDMHYEHSHARVLMQQMVLRRQCELAQKLDLPVVIHSRDGYQETIDVLTEFPDLVYYFHCFGYGVREVEELLELFTCVYFGFDGNSTYPKASHLREACQIVPLERLLLETDSPYLAPQ
jgi:TatD DNase family protein